MSEHSFDKIPLENRKEDPVRTPSSADPLMEGYLDKKTQGKLIKVARWHRRYFKLQGSSLSYYETKYAGVVKGKLELGGSLRSCMRDVNDRAQINMRFKDGTNLTLKCDIADEAQRWADALQSFVPADAAGVTFEHGESDPLSCTTEGKGGAGAVPFADYEKIFASNKRKPRKSMTGIRAGYLWKRALKSGRNWKRRYFILTDDKLSYHVDEFSAATPKGEIALSASCTVREGTGDTANSLELMIPGGGKDGEDTKLFAAAETRHELLAWLHAIEDKLGRLRLAAGVEDPAAVQLPADAAGRGGAGAAGTSAAPGAGGAVVEHTDQGLQLFKAGLLWKRAVASGRNWKKRYFVLTGDVLTYFVNEYKTAHPKGLFELKADTVVRVFHSKTAVELQFLFVLEGALGAKGEGSTAEAAGGGGGGAQPRKKHTKQQREKMYMAAQSSEVRQQWIDAIQARIDAIGAAQRTTAMVTTARVPSRAAFDVDGAGTATPAEPRRPSTFGTLLAPTLETEAEAEAQAGRAAAAGRKVPPLPANIDALTIRELQFHLAQRGVTYNHVREKEELVALLRRSGQAAGESGAAAPESAAGSLIRKMEAAQAISPADNAANTAALLATIARFKATQEAKQRELDAARAQSAHAQQRRASLKLESRAAFDKDVTDKDAAGDEEFDEDGEDDGDVDDSNVELAEGVYKLYVSGDPSSKLPEEIGIALSDFGVTLTGTDGHTTLLFWPWLPVAIPTARPLPCVRSWRAKLQSQDPDDMELLLIEVSGLGVLSFELNDAHALVDLLNGRRKSQVRREEDWPSPPSEWKLGGQHAAATPSPSAAPTASTAPTPPLASPASSAGGRPSMDGEQSATDEMAGYW